MTALCLAGTAHADESTWRFSGYGTLGAVATDADNVQYRTAVNQSHGADKTPDFGVDSRLGAQLDYQFNPTFSAVAQVLAARRNGNERPRLEWLFGQAELGHGAALKVGRMVLPVFLYSDSRNVGYSQHWVRAPSEVYAAYPSSSFDGAQLQWRPRYGGVNFTVQASTGKATADIYLSGLGAEVKYNNVGSLNLIAESGDWTFRLGGTTTRARVTHPMAGVLMNTRDNFFGAGVQYDDGQWLLVGEYTVRRQGDGGADADGAYVSGGRRFGAWLPYLTLAGFDPKGPFYPGMPTGVTTAVGVRWDAGRNVALKTQLESLVPTLQAIVPGTSTPDQYQRQHTASVAVDFVF